MLFKVDVFLRRDFGLKKWKSVRKFLTSVFLPPKIQRPNLVSSAGIGKLARYVCTEAFNKNVFSETLSGGFSARAVHMMKDYLN